tara:strand:- start:157 stop:1131 length:975 start_codon:yes stop_codon:yes gene_type:complete
MQSPTTEDVVRNFDVDQHARSMASINLEQSYQQLHGGPFEGVMHTLQVGPITVFRETVNQSLFQTGSGDADHLTFAVATQLSKPLYWNGKHVDESSVLAFAPGREFELRTSDLSICIGVSLPIDLLATLDPDRPREYWTKTFAAMDCWTEAGNSSLLGAQISNVLDKSDGLARDTMGPYAFADTIESMLDFMSELLARRQPIHHALRVESYPRIARQARALMAERLHEPLSISDICETIGCSRRALRYAFHNVYDVNPATYLRNMRLEAVHRRLVSQPDTTVQNAAEAFGFDHLPRFAQYYARMFGELPSRTLGKRRQRPSPAQ